MWAWCARSGQSVGTKSHGQLGASEQLAMRFLGCPVGATQCDVTRCLSEGVRLARWGGTSESCSAGHRAGESQLDYHRSQRAPLPPSRTQADPRRRTSAQFGLRVLRRTRRAMASQSAMRAAAAETPTALGVRAPSCPAQLGPFVLGHASCVLLNICPYAPRPGPAFGRAIRRRLPRRDGASPR
jgi:hypothetical protein